MRQTMKQHLYTSALVLWIAACGGDPGYREEVIERHQGGEKKVVAVYTGHGTSEQLVERFTYDESGEIVLHEEPLKAKIYTQNWGQWPFVRGLGLLWDALGLGMRTKGLGSSSRAM